ncbi:MAG: hypothetical protein R2873_08000 [Caldilineaceae bacterium]
MAESIIASAKRNIAKHSNTKWLFPNAHHCVVRRFSSKEEKRRIVATVVNPQTFPDAEFLGLKTTSTSSSMSINVVCPSYLRLSFHGLTTFLNSMAVGRIFSAVHRHTQVNATDLRLLKYPSRGVPAYPSAHGQCSTHHVAPGESTPARKTHPRTTEASEQRSKRMQVKSSAPWGYPAQQNGKIGALYSLALLICRLPHHGERRPILLMGITPIMD